MDAALEVILTTLIDDAQKRHEYTLPPDERKFFLTSMAKCLHRQADRWVRGAKSHADSPWKETDFLRALSEELDDAPNYLDGFIHYILNRTNNAG